MGDANKTLELAISGREGSRLRRYMWLLIAFWTVAICASLSWNLFQLNRTTEEMARIQARAAFQQDILYRRWNAMHGGVYAAVSGETFPNPYLEVAERDIQTPLGRQLTLINPAYMTRQVHELGAEESGVQGHITSLNPIRPENAADWWEVTALEAFEQGETERSTIADIDGVAYMRLMHPLLTEESCLKCHAAQGYQEGDVRGGISISVPMSALRATAQKYVTSLVLAHGVLWLLGLLGIIWGAGRLGEGIRVRKRAEEMLRQYAAELEASNEELDTFAHTVAHDLKNPLGLVIGFAETIERDYTALSEEEVCHYLHTIAQSGRKMSNIVDELLLLASVQRMEGIEMQPLDMQRIVTEALKRLTRLIEERQAKIIIPESWPEALGYGPWIEDVWANYVSNAIEYGGTPPRVELGADAEQITNLPHEVCFWVRDNGEGLTLDEQERLFIPFTRLDQVRAKGHGLGLSIVRRIIGKLGGRVGVKSENERGSTFYFTLPGVENP